MFNLSSKEMAKVVGQSVLYASIQASIGSVEMSSKFSVLSFAKDQDTLQRASDALANYLIIGTLWAFGSSLVLYAQYNLTGLILGILVNALMMAWIGVSYWKAFKEASERNNLKMPKLFWINSDK